MPFIRGISRSRTITSGRKFFILPMAMIGSGDTVTRNRESAERMQVRTCLTTAESSTTRTFNGRFIEAGEGWSKPLSLFIEVQDEPLMLFIGSGDEPGWMPG